MTSDEAMELFREIAAIKEELTRVQARIVYTKDRAARANRLEGPFEFTELLGAIRALGSDFKEFIDSITGSPHA